MNVNIFMITFIVLYVILFSMLIYCLMNEINKKNREVSRLKKTVTELENKNEKYRKDHRIEFTNKECTFEIVRIGNRILDQSERKKGKGKIVNLSRSGLKLSCQYDFPARKQIILKLSFEILEQPFSLSGKIIRKEETLEKIAYGIQFVSNDEKTIHKLNQQLLKVEINQMKKMEMLNKSDVASSISKKTK